MVDVWFKSWTLCRQCLTKMVMVTAREQQVTFRAKCRRRFFAWNIVLLFILLLITFSVFCCTYVYRYSSKKRGTHWLIITCCKIPWSHTSYYNWNSQVPIFLATDTQWWVPTIPILLVGCTLYAMQSALPQHRKKVCPWLLQLPSKWYEIPFLRS